MIAVERRRYPPISALVAALGVDTVVHPVKIPIDCVDGFTEAFYARPEAFLRDEVRRAQSAWGFVDEPIQRGFVERLGRDLASGAWDARFGDWRERPEFEGSMRLLVAPPMSAAGA